MVGRQRGAPAVCACTHSLLPAPLPALAGGRRKPESAVRCCFESADTLTASDREVLRDGIRPLPAANDSRRQNGARLRGWREFLRHPALDLAAVPDRAGVAPATRCLLDRDGMARN